MYCSIKTLMMPKLVLTGDKMMFKSIMQCLYPQIAVNGKLGRDSAANDRDLSSSSSSSESDSDSESVNTDEV